MIFNPAFRYHDGSLHVDNTAINDIIAQVGTPAYIYSQKRILDNYQEIKIAFAQLNTHVHYSAKANANLAILKTLIDAGAGIDTVSAGEIFKALKAGAQGENIVFAGVGKSPHEIHFALENNVSWFNVENETELDLINSLAQQVGREHISIALRLNPDVTANTHPYIATGHGGAKFGLTSDTIRHILGKQNQYPYLNFAGIHVHIGSQLGDTIGTEQAVEIALELIAPYPQIKTLNIGGGMPTPYRSNETLPSFITFAKAVTPLLKDYTVLLEPGRSIIADACVLVGEVLYVKEQAGQRILITNTSMTELIRPALYESYHEIIPINEFQNEFITTQVVGPVCETSDILGQDRSLPLLQCGDHIAILTTGAYGMVMASNYNARTRPVEVMVMADGTWKIIRERETWDDLIRGEHS